MTARMGRSAFEILCLVLVLVLAGAATAEESGPSPYWYEVESINPGLGPTPSDLGLDTPQEALDSFLSAAREENWTRARFVLDLSSLDGPAQADQGEDLARRLAKVIERKLWVDWGSLSDRPDALKETGSSDDPLAGQPRKSQRLGILEAGGRPVILRLNRIKPKDGPPVWLFARRTVERIPALYAAHGPGWFERAMPEYWNERPDGWDLRRWEFLVLPLVLGLAVLLFISLRALFGRLASKAKWEMVQNAAAAARLPVALVIAAGALLLAMSAVITFSGPITTVLRPILLALIIIGVAMALLRVIDAVLDVITERYVGDIDDADSKDERHLYTSIYAVRRIVVLIAFVVGIGLLMTQLHLTETLGVSLLASAGVLTVLLGIAGQAVLGNIFASLQIAIGKPIRIGDSVMYEGDWAYVEAIFYTFVRLRTWDDRRLIVPVKYFVSNPFENWSMQDAKMTKTFDLILDHKADTEAVREAYMKLVDDDEDAMEDETKKMLVMEHDHNGITVRFYATAEDPSTAWEMHARHREAMLKWIRENHDDWWPRERVVEAEGTAGRGGAVGDAGG